jgi:hypothetical protein
LQAAPGRPLFLEFELELEHSTAPASLLGRADEVIE